MFAREDDVINRLIPHRLEAIATLNIALRLAREGGEPMKIYLSDRLRIRGNSNAFTNPVFEAGMIHCRALLAFLGLGVSRAAPLKLVDRGPKTQADDWVIEDFCNSAGPLPRVTPQQAVAQYKGGAIEAEAALASVMHVVNKGLAHVTGGLIATATDARIIEIASRGVPALVVSYFYTPMGLPAPMPSITEVARDGSEVKAGN